MKNQKRISLLTVLVMLCGILTSPMTAASAEISYEDLEDIVAIHTYLLGILTGTEAADINEDGCINAVDLTLAKRDLLGYTPPSLEPLRADTWDIYLNEEWTVTFTVKADNVTEPVLLYDEAGNVLAEMNDVGDNVDAVPWDGVYTAQAVLSSDTVRNASFYAVSGDLRSEPFEICFYRDLTEEEISSFREILEQLHGMQYEEAAEFIAQSDEISSYTIDEEQKQIWYQGVCGIHGCFQEAQESDVQTLGSGLSAIPAGIEYDYNEVAAAIASTPITPAHPDKADVIVLCPFREDKDKFSIKSPVFSQFGQLLANALDSNLTEVLDTDVTLKVMKNLDSYGTVLLNTHGILNGSNNVPYIVIGEDTNESYSIFNPEHYSELGDYYSDYVSGRITICTLGETFHKYDRAAVNGEFFDKYYDRGSLDESFWFLGNCYGLYDNSIADVLVDKGAGAVVGFSNETSSHYCFRTCYETVLNSMVLSADKVRTGVYEAMRIYGAKDPSNSMSRLRYAGQADFKLVDQAGEDTGSHNTYFYNNHYYTVINSSVTWSIAKVYCEMKGGYLATITSEDEERFIEHLIQYYNKSDIYWLGATDEEEEGVWKWVNGEEFSYNKWSEGNPNNYNHYEYGYEHYLGITGKNYFYADAFEWNDFADVTYDGAFDYRTGFILEWE